MVEVWKGREIKNFFFLVGCENMEEWKNVFE